MAVAAVCVAKSTWTFGAELARVTAEPLVGNIWSEPRTSFPSVSDYFVTKLATDVVVTGHAFERDGQLFERTSAAVRVGAASKSVAVFGDRIALGTARGGVRFEGPNRVASMPLTWSRCYGGTDQRERRQESSSQIRVPLTRMTHPGCYPRNAYGLGYATRGFGADEGVWLPNAEDPAQLIEPGNLIARPDRWWEQPLPWCFEALHPTMFQRYSSFLGLAPPHVPPEDESMPEVRDRYLPAGYRSRWKETGVPAILPGFLQFGSHGLVLTDVLEGTPVRIEGMHPAFPVVGFKVPKAPRVEWEIAGERSEGRVRLQTVHCRPNDQLVSFTYASDAMLPRRFIPGVHKHIPVAVRIDGGGPVRYHPEQPIRERLAEAAARSEP
jgi:hypothetical protein